MPRCFILPMQQETGGIKENVCVYRYHISRMHPIQMHGWGYFMGSICICLVCGERDRIQ